MENINCDLCGSQRYNKVAEQTDLLHKSTTEKFTVVRCAECGLHFTNPRPSIEEIGRFYSSEYGFHRTTGLIAILKGSFIEEFRNKLANSRLAILLSYVPILSSFLARSVKPKIDDPVLKFIDKDKKQNFLDIGCGSGRSAQFWGPSGSLLKYRKYFEVFGVEPDKKSRDYLQLRGIQCWENIDKINPIQKFDLIRMNWSLEHVHSPSEYFRFISNHLNPTGKAFIMVPNNEGILYKLNQNCLELPIHLYHFSVLDLKAYTHTFGMEVIDINTFSYPAMFQMAAKNGLLSKKFLFAENLSIAQKTMPLLGALDDMGWGNDLILTLQTRDLKKDPPK